MPARLFDTNRMLESALAAHRSGAMAAGIQPCRDPGPPLIHESEHIANFLVRHSNCALVQLKFAAHLHGPYEMTSNEVKQQFRCGDEVFELAVRRVVEDPPKRSERADIAVFDAAKRTLYCLLCPDGGSVIRTDVDSTAVDDMVQTHVDSRHRRVASYLRVNSDNLAFWLVPA